MIVQVDPIHLFWLAIIGMSLLGAAAAVGRWLIAQSQQRTDAQVTMLLEGSRKWEMVESQLMELRIELPERYVRREDYVRNQSVLENKIDRVFEQLEVLRQQGAQFGRRGES